MDLVNIKALLEKAKQRTANTQQHRHCPGRVIYGNIELYSRFLLHNLYLLFSD